MDKFWKIRRMRLQADIPYGKVKNGHGHYMRAARTYFIGGGGWNTTSMSLLFSFFNACLLQIFLITQNLKNSVNCFHKS